MKTRRIKAAAAANPASKRVHFEFKEGSAHNVCVAGTFNEWHPQSAPMLDVGGGRWVKDLMLAPGRYEYLFVVDGRWLPDPAVDDCAPNPYGGWNSRLNVT